VTEAAPTPARTVLLGALVFLLMLPVTLPVPVLRGLVLERYDVSETQASLFMSVNMLGALLTAPLVGLLADRFGRRRRLATAALLLDSALMYWLAHASSFAELMAVRAVEGAAHIAALSLVLALCADNAGPHRGRVMGMLGAGLTLGVATGAALGGVLGREHPVAALHGACLLLLAAAISAWSSLPRDTGAAGRPGLRAIATAVLAHRRLLVPLGFALIDRFTVGFFTTGFPLLLAGVHEVPPRTIGMLLAAFLYPFALLSYPFGRLAERRSRVRLMATGSLLYGAGAMLVGVLEPGWLWVLMPCLGAASAVMFVPTMLLTIELAPAETRATALAAFNAAGSLGLMLGPAACGAIVGLGATPEAGYGLAFGAAGLSEIACVLLLLPFLRRIATSRG
jgi:MFS family permease